ncbi:MAG TPA: hypothetical protein VN428_18080 [Bryobacteraceae bacterium]|nr:hypothetical protein [Bryobacteraceae bacterium]
MQDDIRSYVNDMIEVEPVDDKGLHRRDLLRGAGTLTAWLAASNTAQAKPAAEGDKVPPAQPGAPLPLARFGKYKVTRFVAGANPIYGYSHFNYVFSATMGEYHTTERVVSFLKELESAGLNTWQASWSERLETDWLRYKEQGGKMQLFVLSRPNFNDTPEILSRVMKLKPIGISQHGATTNRFWDAGQFDKSLEYLKRIRDTGAMVGLSCHNPLEIERADEKGWDIDYYMASLYYLIRPRAEFEKLLNGNVPHGEIYLPADPPRMMETVRKTKKPCLIYKVLAAGRTVNSPQQVKERMKAAFDGIKPDDALLIGIYQRFNDQIGQTAQFTREILTA